MWLRRKLHEMSRSFSSSGLGSLGAMSVYEGQILFPLKLMGVCFAWHLSGGT